MAKRVLLAALLLFIQTLNHSFAQWQSVNSGVTVNLADGCFVSDSTGFVISLGGIVLKTVDQGNTWYICTSLQGNFTSICSSGPDTIYAAGDHVYRSNDRGMTWNLVASPDVTFTDMGFFRNGYGFGLVPGYFECTWNGYTVHYNDYKVYKSTDFGLNWQLIMGSMEPSSRFQFINDTTAYVTGGTHYIVAHCAGPWFDASKKTTNRGVSWQQAQQPYWGGYYFYFINNLTGYFLNPGDSYNLYKTVDGGGHFDTIYTEILDYSVRQVIFFNEIDGYTLGRKNIYVTTSEGFEWKNDYSSEDTLNVLVQNPARYLFALGRHGTILKKKIIESSHSDTVYRVRLSSNSLAFGYVTVDSLAKKTVTITNTGNLAMDISLDASERFRIGFTDSSFATHLEINLFPFQDTVLYVQFSPQEERMYQDSVVLSAGKIDTIRIPVSGTGFRGLIGAITKDTIICTDTLRIGGNVTVNPGVKLEICAGTYVEVLGTFQISVQGGIKVLGDSIHPVRFGTPGSAVSWNGISVVNSDVADSSLFRYCIINTRIPLQFINVENGKAIVDHCEITNPNPGQYGIRIGSGADAVISHCNLHGNNTAIECVGSSNSDIRNCVLFDNTQGISTHTNGLTIISGNQIFENDYLGIEGNGNVFILGNKIYDNGGGIDVSGSGIRIENNEIFNNYSTFTGGVSCGVAGTGVFIIQNLIFNNSSSFGNGAGINLAPDNEAQPAYIINNTICNNEVAPGMKGSEFYATTNTAAGLRIELHNNIFFNLKDTANSVAWFKYVEYNIDYNCFIQKGISGIGPNNIFADPLIAHPTDSVGRMVNIGTYDWAMTGFSPCIDKGNANLTGLVLPDDFAGNPRIYNNLVDIGAYEYQWPYSVPEGNFRPKISVFPNPTNGICYFSVGWNLPSEIVITDLFSRALLRRNFSNFISVDMTSFHEGIYFFEIIGPDGIIGKGKVIRD